MKISFIGMGNMAQALLGGFIKGGVIAPEEAAAYAPNREKLLINAEKYGFAPASSPEDALSKGDLVILAVKPHQIEGVIAGLGDAIEGKAFISIAAGWSMARFGELLGDKARMLCVMPNTPSLAGRGVALFEQPSTLTGDEYEAAKKLFGSVGEVIELPSSLMGAGGAISGCGPAFVDIFMEAYADAAVKYGIPRDTALKLVSATVEGAGALVRVSGEHPAVLKDRVCSPGGTTICGVTALEEYGLRAACQASVDAVMSKEL